MTEPETLEAQNRRLQEALSAHLKSEEALRQTVAQLTANVRELEQFAYITSHDLQAPLRSIAGFSQLLSRRYKDRLDGEALEFLGYIEQSVHQMQMLIQDLLKLSRIGRGGPRFEVRPLADALSSALRHLEDKVASSHASIESEELPTLSADHALMALLFEQLIDNAIKFRRSDVAPRISVSAREEGADFLITVADNGIGIAQDQLDNVFLVFRRLHAPDAYPGSGIGLTICRKIAALHGGRIEATSDASGSRFVLRLPKEPANPAGPARSPSVADAR